MEARDERSGGSRPDFAALYEEYVGPIYRYCYVRLQNRQAAEDVTSDVFLKALRSFEHFRGGGVAAWLFQIAHNEVANSYRRRRRSVALTEADEPRDPSPLTEDQVERATDAQELLAALARLTDEQRAVIELSLAGWSGREVAAAMGKSAAAVKMLRYRGIVRLRDLLIREDEHDD